MPTNATGYVTLGDVARHFGVRDWQIRRLFERGLLPDPPRMGIWRVIAADDLPAVGEALRAAGYLKETATAGAVTPAVA